MTWNTVAILAGKDVNVPRKTINPPLKLIFSQVYQAIIRHGGQTPVLLTTGGVQFVAKAKQTRDGRVFISLPHNNRIYADDWGYRTNSMGKNGQWIAHYSVPLDEWAQGLVN